MCPLLSSGRMQSRWTQRTQPWRWSSAALCLEQSLMLLQRSEKFPDTVTFSMEKELNKNQNCKKLNMTGHSKCSWEKVRRCQLAPFPFKCCHTLLLSTVQQCRHEQNHHVCIIFFLLTSIFLPAASSPLPPISV